MYCCCSFTTHGNVGVAHLLKNKLILFFNFIHYFYNSLKNIFANTSKRPTEGVLGFFLALLPLLIQVYGTLVWARYSNIFEQHNVLYWVAFGFSFAYFNVCYSCNLVVFICFFTHT